MPKLSTGVAFAAILPLAGCLPAAVPERLVLPADPDASVRSPRYAAVTAGVKDFRVVEPKDWRELNRQVAPNGGAGGMDGMPGMGGKRDMGGR